jgi:predicted PurR-regulated permease PerM
VSEDNGQVRPDAASLGDVADDGAAESGSGDETARNGARNGAINSSYFTYAFGLAAGALSAYALLRVAAHAQSVLVLVALSLFFAVSLNPIVTALTRQRRVPMPRWAAVLVVGIGVLGLVAGFLAVIVPPVDHEVTALAHQVPHLLNEAQDKSTWLGRMEAKYHVFTKIESALSSKSLGVNAVSGVVGAGKYVLDMLTSTLAVVALTIYFLAGLPNVVNTVYRTVPASRRARARALGDEILTQVGRYMLGSALNASIAGLATFVWTAILGIPYPAALGLLVALLDMVPVIGSTVGGAIVTLVALAHSLPVALATLAFYIAFRLTEDYVLLPKVMRHAVNVPPIATVVAVLIGGALMGIIGALMAIPTAAALKLITQEILMPRLDRR